ncbi:CLUMA_CG007865, isoform A [Clunio marinus]|uniref:CLUMA_CG007865, isoform A n=1 Tax=Clunio marinus TaxID=568069 RepID=A0A1J1I1Y1_9DIPT|nr:CLUMA_CG007865, isoform A [Clunio marinus]
MAVAILTITIQGANAIICARDQRTGRYQNFLNLRVMEKSNAQGGRKDTLVKDSNHVSLTRVLVYHTWEHMSRTVTQHDHSPETGYLFG